MTPGETPSRSTGVGAGCPTVCRTTIDATYLRRADLSALDVAAHCATLREIVRRTLGLLAGALVGCGGVTFTLEAPSDSGVEPGVDAKSGVRPESGAPSDGGASDSSTRKDSSAGADSRVPGCSSYCAMYGAGANFCSDFDCPPSLADWVVIDQTSGTAMLEHLHVVSQPNALQALLPPVTTPTSFSVGVENAFPGSWTHVEVELDVWLPTFPANTVVDTNLVLFGARPTAELLSGGVGLVYSGDGAFFVSGTCAPDCTVRADLGCMGSASCSTPPPLTGAFNHMKLDFGVGKEQSVTLLYTGNDGVAHTVMATGDTATVSPAAGITLAVGMATNGGAKGTTTETFTAYYDNVVLRLQ